jgi:hypothetical protein
MRVASVVWSGDVKSERNVKRLEIRRLGEERRSACRCWQWGYMWIVTVVDVVGEMTQ